MCNIYKSFMFEKFKNVLFYDNLKKNMLELLLFDE